MARARPARAAGSCPAVDGDSINQRVVASARAPATTAAGLALRAQLGAARAGHARARRARATNLGLPNKRALRRLTDRRARARARLRARESNPIQGHSLVVPTTTVRGFRIRRKCDRPAPAARSAMLQRVDYKKKKKTSSLSLKKKRGWAAAQPAVLARWSAASSSPWSRHATC